MPLPNLSLWFYVSFQILSIRAIVRSWKFVKARLSEELHALLIIMAGLPGLIYFERFRFAGQQKRYRCGACLTWQE
jgi:hypothetical protein